MSLARRITTDYGGDWHGNYGCVPTPGHSKRDRGMKVQDAPDAPDGLLVHSFNGGDPLALKDEFRQRGYLPPLESTRRRDDRPAWIYTDENGRPLYRKVRVDRADRKYTVEHPDGAGGWKPGRGGAEPVPYRLADLLAADPSTPLYMAEGEKHADKLASWGLLATSLKDWRTSFARHVAGRKVFILPDNDQPGEKQAADAERLVGEAGGTPVIVRLPGLPPAGDIVDWDGDVSELLQLSSNAIGDERQTAPTPAFRRGISASALMAKSFSPIRWIVPGYLVGGMSLLAGAPKLGKSWLALGWMLAVASGGQAMGSIQCEQGDVLGLMLEDNERRLQRRLRQLRRPNLPDRLTLVTEWPNLDDGCCQEIEAWIASAKNPRLIVVDVYARVKGTKGGKETDYDSDYRQAAMLQAIASRHGLAVVLIHHTRKMTAEDPFDEVSGTRGLTGAADSVLVLKRNPGAQEPVLYGRGRDLEEIETALQFDKETGEWSILGAAWQVADTAERRDIQHILGRSVDPMSPTEIADRLGKSRQNVQKMLGKMLEEGKVHQISRGRYTLVSMVSPVSPVAPVPSPLETRETIETDHHARAPAYVLDDLGTPLSLHQPHRASNSAPHEGRN